VISLLLILSAPAMFILFLAVYALPVLTIGGFVFSPFMLYALAFACPAIAVMLVKSDSALTDTAKRYFDGFSKRLFVAAAILLILGILVNLFLLPQVMSTIYMLAIFIFELFGYILHLKTNYYAFGMGMMNNVKA
jgi:hypothetical protein